MHSCSYESRPAATAATASADIVPAMAALLGAFHIAGFAIYLAGTFELQTTG